MNINKLLKPEAIIPQLQARYRDEILLELAQQIVHANNDLSLDAKEIAQLLLERERVSSTNIGGGIAIPHSRMSNLAQPLAALGIYRDQNNNPNSDEQSPFLFFALISPNQAIAEHLRILARICRLFKGTNLSSQLLELHNASEIHDLITEHEILLANVSP
jgi:PTS system nitrogen regulatory IIA component